MVHRHILAAIVYPEVHDTGVALCLTHGVGDVAATFGVLYPELADALIGVRESETARLRMREAGRVEVEHGVVGLSPVYP